MKNEYTDLNNSLIATGVYYFRHCTQKVEVVIVHMPPSPLHNGDEQGNLYLPGYWSMGQQLSVLGGPFFYSEAIPVQLRHRPFVLGGPNPVSVGVSWTGPL
uniref:Uncharacterized protein n=1 Tax=Sphaerodactylus townsendi TaxID=933632 RepID=A0ACB8FJM2_9SAUR